jgi:hypothetical protein
MPSEDLNVSTFELVWIEYLVAELKNTVMISE